MNGFPESVCRIMHGRDDSAVEVDHDFAHSPTPLPACLLVLFRIACMHACMMSFGLYCIVFYFID